MSAVSVTLPFADGQYRFSLPMRAVVEIERLTEKALGEIYDQLVLSIGVERDTAEHRYIAGGPLRMKDCYHVIRLAAQYGGEAEIAGETVKIGAVDATRLVDTYVDGCYYTEWAPTAWKILHYQLTGIDVKKKADETAAVTSD